MDFSYRLVPVTKSSGIIEPKKMANYKKFYTFVLPIEIELSGCYRPESHLVDDGTISAVNHTIDMRSIILQLFFEQRRDKSGAQMWSLKREYDSHSPVTSFTTVEQFMSRCAVVSAVVDEYKNTFPMTIEATVDHIADKSIVLPFMKASREDRDRSSFDDVRVIELEMDAMMGHCGHSPDCTSVHLLRHARELEIMLGNTATPAVAATHHINSNRVAMYGLDGSTTELTYVDVNMVYYPFVWDMMEAYLKHMRNKRHTKNLMLRYEDYRQRIMDDCHDSVTWRVETETLRKAFAWAFFPIESLGGFIGRYSGIPSLVTIDFRNFDARSSSKTVVLARNHEVVRQCWFRLLVFVARW